MIEYVTNNWEGIVAVLAGLHAVAVAVVNLTPTPKDDEYLAKAYGYIEVLAGLFTTKAKESTKPTEE